MTDDLLVWSSSKLVPLYFQEDVPGSLSGPVPNLLQRELDDLVSGDWMN